MSIPVLTREEAEKAVENLFNAMVKDVACDEASADQSYTLSDGRRAFVLTRKDKYTQKIQKVIVEITTVKNSHSKAGELASQVWVETQRKTMDISGYLIMYRDEEDTEEEAFACLRYHSQQKYRNKNTGDGYEAGILVEAEEPVKKRHEIDYQAYSFDELRKLYKSLNKKEIGVKTPGYSPLGKKLK